MLNKCLSIFLLLTFLSACNEVEQKSDGEILVIQSEAKNLQIDNVLGYWIPLTPNNYAFEFFPSVFDGAYSNEIMTGKIYQNDQVFRIFSWDLDANGQINLRLFEPSCSERPITLCNTKGSMGIQARGDDLQNAFWEISHDQDNDGYIDLVSGVSYKKKLLDLSLNKEGSLYLIPINEYFSGGTIVGNNSNGNVELEFMGGTVSSLITNSPKSELSFNETTTVTSNRTFDVSNVGYYDFVIETSFENVALRPSASDSFSYSYELHRKVIIPDGIDESSIDFDDFSTLDKRTGLFRYIDTFIDAPEINIGDNFFSLIVFSQGSVGAINDILFNSATSGIMTSKNVIEDEQSGQIDFSWEKSIDGAVLLNTSEGSLVTVRFIREISGGYSVLMITEEDKIEKSYFVHDFVKDNAFEITDDMFPGRYQIKSDNGFTNILISFTADGIVEFQNFPDLGGHWFINEEGNLISFECTDFLGDIINDYNTCLDSFSVIGTPSRYTQFSHIRELKFLHRSGDDFLIKYNASFWGGPFGVDGPDYFRANWTYRMMRIGDVNDNGSN